MKLYIPTCTLNFNNILSSESISPLGFYARRGFGNKRFYSVRANDKEQVIISYSKYPRFEVEENGLENYPMVIEIETDDYKDGFFEKAKEHNGVETYLCYHTINLNPFHCRIYFYSSQEYSGVLSKAEQSLENKFYKLYAPNIGVKPIGVSAQSEEGYFLWEPSYANCKIKNEPTIDVNVGRDVQLDRIKGFIYCYLIGANSSVSNEVGKLKALSRKLRNTLSAVVNSPDKKPTQAQDDAISNGVREFNEIYSSIDEDIIWNNKLLEPNLSNPYGISTEDAKNLFQYLISKFDLYDAICNKLPLRRVYDANELRSCLKYVSPEEFSRVTDNMDSAIRKLEAKDNAQREKYAIEKLLNVNVGDNLSLHILDTSYQSSFYKNLICSQFKAEYKSVMEEKGVEEPVAQAYTGGKILKNMLGDKWGSNSASTYVGKLLDHFRESSAFDLFAIKNDVLSSFAAFCQKGDDIDRLAEYLVQTGFCNYKLAYGIYGATRGFASLPKTFTSVLIDGDKEYYQSFASNVWRMLNGVEIKDAVLPKASKNTSASVGSPIEHTTLSPEYFMCILGNISKRTNAYKKLDQEKFAKDTGVYTTPKELKEKICQIIGRKDMKNQEDKINFAIELEAERQNRKAFLETLNNSSLKPGAKERIAKIVEEELPFDPPMKNKSTITTQVNTDASRIDEHFISDSNCRTFLEKMVPAICRTEFFEDLKWFQNEYAKGEDSDYYAKASRENPATIEAFIRYLSKRKYNSQIPIPELKDYLYKKYVRKDNYNK